MQYDQNENIEFTTQKRLVVELAYFSQEIGIIMYFLITGSSLLLLTFHTYVEAIYPSVNVQYLSALMIQNQSDSKSFTSSYFPWTIVYPASWSIDETCCKGHYGFLTLRDPNSTVTLRFTNTGVSQSENLSEAQKLINNDFNYDDFSLISSKNITFANLSAIEILYVYNPLECGSPDQLEAAYCEYYQEPGSKPMYKMSLFSSIPSEIEYYSAERNDFFQNLDTARMIINSSSIGKRSSLN